MKPVVVNRFSYKVPGRRGLKEVKLFILGDNPKVVIAHDSYLGEGDQKYQLSLTNSIEYLYEALKERYGDDFLLVEPDREIGEGKADYCLVTIEDGKPRWEPIGLPIPLPTLEEELEEIRKRAIEKAREMRDNREGGEPGNYLKNLWRR